MWGDPQRTRCVHLSTRSGTSRVTAERATVRSVNARQQLDEMISGYRATQIIRTAVLLCIPEALANGPLTSVAVAERLGLDQHVLVHRLMRCLARFGVLVEQSDGRFANSEMGALLLPGAPGGAARRSRGTDRGRLARGMGELCTPAS